MGLVSSLTAVRTAITTNVPGFTTNNCSIGDESVFNYIQTTAGQSKCCVLDYGGFAAKGRSEFRSSTIEWSILVNGFFMIQGEDVSTALVAARSFLDSFAVMLAQNPMLDGGVSSAKLTFGDEFIDYKRGNFSYILAVAVVEVLDNIS